MSNNIIDQLALIRMDAAAHPRIGAYHPEALAREMEKIISMAYLLLGAKADDAMITFQGKTIADLLQQDELGMRTYNLSVEEVAIVVRRAILTDAAFTKVSPAMICRAVAAYIKNESKDVNAKVAQVQRSQQLLGNGSRAVDTMITSYAGSILRNNK